MLRSTVLLLALAGSLAAQTMAWTLPQSPSECLPRPRTWRITSLYQTMDLHGAVMARQRVSALYSREASQVRWSAADLAIAGPGEAPFGPGQRRSFMEGFSYPHAEIRNQMKASFFKAFPQDAALERNLVWDTHMFEFFGQNWLGSLRLNETFQVPLDTAAIVNLAGTGIFRNTRIELTWTGQSQRRGRACAVVDYRAFHNRLEMTVPAKLKGRSHYWGQIWISQTDGQVEFATLFEDVLGEMSLSGRADPLMINVFRTATFEPLGE